MAPHISDANAVSQQHRLSRPAGVVLSIANMAKKAAPSTPEARAITAGIEASSITKAAIADRMGVSPSMVSQWASGYRPVAAPQAGPLARILNLDPTAISVEYRRVASSSATSGALAVRDHPESDPYAMSALQIRIDALELAVGALFAATTHHGPLQAQEVAATLKKRVPAKQREQGLLHELIAMMDKAKP